MAQDVFSKMAEEPWLLNEDGYLNADTDIKEIIYHPTLNVILICTKSGIVRVLDVNSGVVLQSSQLSALNSNEVTCRYISGQDRILFTDGQAIGVRSDYNGVLLLDSILQKVITDSKEEVKVELPLSEAVILKESLLLPNISLKLSGNKVSDCDSVDHIINELTDVISNAQKQSKKGIKAQKWNTVCLKLPLNDLKMATSNSVTDLLAKHHRTPELAVASAVQERVSELLGETANASDRRAMASESKRRDTFSQWPHMDYKWALPEQMAQAGFYHQPNSSGDDRAMCFTCNVCLVCWERTDEPWSEHERHSQNCPFVMGEYTQNIPLSVTYATCPAVDATYRGVNVQVLGSSTVGHLMPTSNEEGLISVFDIGGKVKRTHSFFVSQFDSHILEKITQEFGILGVWSDTDDGKYPTEKTITALSVVSEKTASSSQEIRPTVVCGLTIKAKTKNAFSIDALNDKNKKESSTSSASIMDVNYPDKTSCIFLVVYDFMYSKDQENKDLVKDDSASECTEEKLIKLESVEEDEAKDGAYIHFPNGIVGSWAYKTLIPEEGDEMFFPPLQNSNTSPKTYSGPRSIDPDTTETDSSSPNFIINFHNGPSTENGPKSISDHINELKSNKTNKKLNYSRAVQCLALPDAYKNRKDLQVSSILTTQDGWHVLVVLKSVEHLSSVLIVYALDFSAKMVKLCPDYMTVRELGDNESPVEVGILPPVDKLDLGGEVEGNAVLVCADGAVRIVQMSTLRTICYAKLESEKFVSAAYCNSLERLCASTEKGSLHFYALNDTDNESLEDHDEEDMFALNLDNPSTNQPTDSTLDNCETTKYFHEPPEIIPESDLKRLYNLTLFEPLKAGYCAVVPPCWSEIQQAQRQRRHPQSLNVDCEQYTKTWRLQTDLTTWDEHMFEITLPTPMSLGHVDVHFTLQPSTLTPHVEVTLLRQNTSGIGHKRDVKFSVDESVTIDMLQWADNPVITQEYLRAHNADILAGPINIATCLDLSEQSGVVTLTSPKLFKSRNRTLLLHLRVVYSKEEENNRANVKGKRSDASKSATLNMLDKFALNNRKTEYFMGCDCIHELSVTVYTSKHTEIAGEKLQRTLMLESNAFVQSLLLTAATPNTDEVQGLVLDILSWVASIRLTRNRSYVGEPPTQQIEFLHLIQENLHSLLYGCLIDGVRQITHKCAKIFVTCHSGAKNFNEQIGSSFEGNLLNTLVLLLEHLSSIKSAAGLQWLMNLMINLATDKEQSLLVSTKCAELLSDVSNELTKRINPYHLVLRTRYGLYGTPMDPELFDVDPPPYPKGSSLSLTYASVVAAEPPVTNSNFYANYSFYKENLSPKEVLSASETKIKGKHIAPPRVVKGLIETEPLHFICVGASEGTRLEKAGEGGITLPTSAIINNHVVNTMSNNEPVTYITNSGAGGSSNVVGHKNKDKLEHFWNNVVEIVTKVKKSGSNSSEFSDKLHAFPIKNLAKFNIPETFQLKKGAKPDTANIWSSDMDILLSPEKPQIHQNAWGSSEDFLSPSEAAAPNLWQHLFVPPTQQVIVVERMHSGARRYVTVDFGQPVLLTDVMIPYCADLVSISIDIWLKGEDVDPVRLVVSSDINSKNLILNDLQPSPLCRFMKITTVGRYGMSTTRCRIPVGYFYGHIALISEEATNNNVQEPSSSTSATSLSENDKQLATLTKLLEDIGCKYSLSCSKLKESLESYIESDIKNSAHLSVYMNIMKDKHSSISSEHSKIFQAYREAITYQKQLNTIRNIILRIERASTNKKTKKQAPSTFTNISTDKLRIIAESLLEVLLSIDSTSNIDAENCQKLFQGLCVSQSPRLQFLAAMFLKNACGTKNFWGNFLADTLADMFSTSYNSIFPQDRVFITIAYLSRKSFQRSSIIDATLRVIYEALQPLNDSTSLLAVSVDLPHLSWLLMFLSLQLDMNKSAQDSVARWDWVFGEMIGKANVENAKPRLTKKTYKGDLKMGPGYDKIMPVMKCPPDMFMKKAIYCNVPLKFHKNEANTTKKATIKDKEPPNEPSGSEKSSPKKIPLFVGLKHCLIVAKSLINLVLKMDHSSSADMLLLSFKVIARLCILVKLRLGELMSEEQLLQLVNFCLASKIPWAPHALTCLLEDIVNVSMKPNKQSPEMETETSASTSWANTNDIDEAIALEENLIINSFPQLAKGQKNTQLPSVYESDDSDLEELMEEFLDKDNVTKKTTPTNKLVSNSNPPNSNAIDSRLDMGVETSSEIFLRKLITSNTSTLVTNITCLGPNNEREESLLPWPTSITINLQPESKSNNNKMLTQCFESLFQNLQIQSPSSVEHILQLYFTLNSQFTTITMPSIYPQIVLSSQSVDMLISTLTWMPGLSLVTWTIALQTLTMVCNTTISQSQWNDISGMAATIVNHRDFINCLMRLLSGNGIAYSEKGLAGPTVCKSLHDLLVRLQMRCDIVSPTSKLGGHFKTLLLKLVYQLVQPHGPVVGRQGPLDVQCKVLQSMLHIDFGNADLGMAISILESTGNLVHSYVTHVDRIKCNSTSELTNATFRSLYTTVLGADPNKQDRPVSHEVLLIALLKLLKKLIKTPFPNENHEQEAMDIEPTTSQTDESKVEQIQNSSTISPPPQVPCLADVILQHHPSIIRLCNSLAGCKSSSLCMLACISQKFSFVSNFSEPNTISDAVFHVLITLVKTVTNKELLMQPLMMFLGQIPQLSEPLLWFILQVLDTEEAIRGFYNAGGITILGKNFVNSSSTPSTISKTGTISTVMQYFNKSNRPESNTASTSKKSTMDEQLENRLSLVNFAPCSTIKCTSGTAQPAEVLIQGTTTTHRRARTPQWSYHFYPEEVYTELILQLPSATLLKQIHLQPHSMTLNTCPSAVGVEISSGGPSRLVPIGPPIATSGMSYIQLDLPVAEVVNCVLIRLYKPRTANNISLSQIRLLGFGAFNSKATTSSFLLDDELHCKHSLGWLRIMHHCFTLPLNTEFKNEVVSCTAQVPNLLTTACGLLIVPSHIIPDYLPCLEKVLREISLHNLDTGVATMKILLDSKCGSVELSENTWQEKLLFSNNGYQSSCELLYQICEHQDDNTKFRINLLVEWLKTLSLQAVETDSIQHCKPAYISSAASIIWFAHQSNVAYDLKGMITEELFDAVYALKTHKLTNTPLKRSLDSLLCSTCYIRPELYQVLLQRMGILVPNTSTDLAASISDDRKDKSMTDDNKQLTQAEWYEHFVLNDLSSLTLNWAELETLALVSRSPTAIQQLLDSGLTKKLNNVILEFCKSSQNCVVDVLKLEGVTKILKFFTDVCEEKHMQTWLGSSDGSSFWLPLLHWLCKKPVKFSFHCETHAYLEDNVIKFLAKCCLCHPSNQTRLAKVLCDVIALQTDGITGFMRRLILQLLLENEKIPVSVLADETLYKNVKMSPTYIHTHPAFKQTYKRALLCLSTNTTLSEILYQHIYFNPHTLENPGISKKQSFIQKNDLLTSLFAEDSEMSVAAGVLAKDKRAKDNKTQVSTPVKKKRYTADQGVSNDSVGGRYIKCEAYGEQYLPLQLTLGQLLKMLEAKESNSDWPCIHLTVYQKIGSEERTTSEVVIPVAEQQSYSSALQVFSSMGGLALLAQHLPTVYPETVRPSSSEEKVTNSEPSDLDWVKVEDCDDYFNFDDDANGSSSPSKTNGLVSNVPPHSLTAFGLFLRLPGYAEILLKDMKEALCLLRLVLGVTDDGEGGDIFQSSVANTLPTLPFEVLGKLYDSTLLSTDDGRLLRRISITSGVVHLLLACLGIFTHQTTQAEKDAKDSKSKEEKSQLYWAKGTGFGTGSTQQSWNVEQALLKQRSEEEHVTVFLQVLASYVNPNGQAADELADDVLPSSFHDLLANSSLLPALSSYLRNDSVLDMARHIPLYRAALLLLRALAVSSQLVDLLLPQKNRINEPSICSLLKNMKNCVDTYASKLRINTKSKSKFEVLFEDLEQGEGLATLMPDIQDTATLVANVTNSLLDSDGEGDFYNSLERPLATSLEETYLKFMKTLQFSSYEMISDLPEGGLKFEISHHFESNAKTTPEQSHPSRVKRIAQEAVTLSTSLPLSYSSCVFVRYDTSRLDVMKVLITGPSDTPYANGCFELDVFFPQDYPTSPMLINLETTGHHTVRFNPNLYNDGKVCLSVLNTWHGRPEEKWNAQTSSFLQVLVSIQSLILVPEPYFNEPGYERSRGTPAGTQSSKEYNTTICQATVRWAMLEQVLNPCPCFKDVIHAHFYLKRQEIIDQVDSWVRDMECDTSEKRPTRTNKRTTVNTLDNFKKVVQQLKDSLMKLTPPPSLEDTPTHSPDDVNQECILENDVEMEKMVNEMCE